MMAARVWERDNTKPEGETSLHLHRAPVFQSSHRRPVSFPVISIQQQPRLNRRPTLRSHNNRNGERRKKTRFAVGRGSAGFKGERPTLFIPSRSRPEQESLELIRAYSPSWRDFFFFFLQPFAVERLRFHRHKNGGSSCWRFRAAPGAFWPR